MSQDAETVRGRKGSSLAQHWRGRIGKWLGVVFIPQSEEDARLAELERALVDATKYRQSETTRGEQKHF